MRGLWGLRKGRRVRDQQDLGACVAAGGWTPETSPQAALLRAAGYLPNGSCRPQRQSDATQTYMKSMAPHKAYADVQEWVCMGCDCLRKVG